MVQGESELKGLRSRVLHGQLWSPGLSQGQHLELIKKWISYLSSGSPSQIFIVPAVSWRHSLNGFQGCCDTVHWSGAQRPRDGHAYPALRVKGLPKLLAFPSLSRFWSVCCEDQTCEFFAGAGGYLPAVVFGFWLCCKPVGTRGLPITQVCSWMTIQWLVLQFVPHGD